MMLAWPALIPDAVRLTKATNTAQSSLPTFHDIRMRT
jgi:hypothetical protein